jgi:hypothetical protein
MILQLRTALAAALVLVLAMPGAEARTKHRHKPAPKPAADQAIQVETLTLTLMPPVKTLHAAWTQYGPQGVLEARAVVAAAVCPDLALDLHRVPMMKRADADHQFKTVCWAPIPAGTKQAALVFGEDISPPPPLGSSAAAERAWIEKISGGTEPDAKAPITDWLEWQRAAMAKTKYDVVPLPVPVSDPQRIVVLGDTGCRIKGKALQDCSKEEEWPFARIAREAARLKPDLVIHVGDYLYRENACQADFSGCQGTPFGDNWPTWDADFFAPAKPLLAVAPWVIVRGNHEDCQRAGPGFLRLLGPAAFDPAAACADHLPQYAIPFAGLHLVVSDNADAPEKDVTEKVVPTYRAEIAALANEKAPAWLLNHRPIWGLVSGPLGIPAGGNQTLIAAAGTGGIPAPVELMLSGHIHTFEAINYDPENHVPPQLVAGFGGDRLDPTPENLRGAIFQGSSGVGVHDGLSVGGFGFVLMTKVEPGWRVDVYDSQGRIGMVCQFAGGRLNCPHKKR